MELVTALASTKSILTMSLMSLWASASVTDKNL